MIVGDSRGRDPLGLYLITGPIICKSGKYRRQGVPKLLLILIPIPILVM